MIVFLLIITLLIFQFRRVAGKSTSHGAAYGARRATPNESDH